MFDFAPPKYFPARVGNPLGVGQHPHRGFETVTIAFEGEVEHHDNTGKSGVIQRGDVQWMTAGRGIIHQEYHSKQFTKTGGIFSMAQLWVNLPKKDKMVKPSFQAIKSENIPVVNLPLDSEEPSLGRARIIAGELGSTKGSANTFSPVQVWDVILPHVDAEIDLPFPADHNCIVFVRSGSVEVLTGGDGTNKSKLLAPQEVALMHMDGGDTLRIRVVVPDSSLLIVGGEPLNEPIAAHGPFVMNTQEEIIKTLRDYRLGDMGRPI